MCKYIYVSVLIIWTAEIVSCLMSQDSYPVFRFDYKYSDEADGWFKLHRMPRTFSDAKNRCVLEGAEMAAPTSREMVNAMMFNFVFSPPWDGAYVDIHATFAPGEYQYKGVPLERMPVDFLPSGPQYPEGKDCIVFFFNSSIVNEECTRRLPFLCFKKRTEDAILSSCGTVDPEYNYDRRTGSCYKFHTKGQNWQTAYTTCVAEGAHLAVVNTATEITVLQEIIKHQPASSLDSDYNLSIFLGFIDLDKTGKWTTVLGKPLSETYESWHKGEPNNITGKEFCGNLLIGGLMNDAPCDFRLTFMCEKNPKSLL